MPSSGAPPPRRRFRFRRKIGAGAFGEVYLAELITGAGFSKMVAVKLLKPDLVEEEDVLARMRDEARLLGQLRHPAIVQADDLVYLAGRLAVVMEYVPGANLLWLIHPRHNPEPLPATVCLAIIRRVAEALDAAWSRPSTLTGQPLQVLHRDIKPSNIRVTPDGEVKVLDFGVARAEAMDRDSSTRDQLIGSLTFIAPEVFLHQGPEPASDIYALGVTFFESLARARFGRCGLNAEQHWHLQNQRLDAVRLPDWHPIEGEVKELLAWMLDFEPTRRPSAAQVALRCRSLAQEAPGPDLQDWAAETVDRVAASADPDLPGELVGQTLEEQTTHAGVAASDGSRAASPSLSGEEWPPEEVTEVDDAPAKPRKRRTSVLLLLGLALMSVAVIGFILWMQGPWRAEKHTDTLALVVPASPTTTTVPAVATANEPPVSDPITTAGSAAPPPMESGAATAPVAPVTPAPAVAPAVQAAAPRSTSSSTPAATREKPVPAPTTEPKEQASGTTFDLQVSGPRRMLRNSTMTTTINTGTSGCAVSVFWKVEGEKAWTEEVLAGSGPTFVWTFPITAAHRPALLYYVSASRCGTGSHGGAANPVSVVVR